MRSITDIQFCLFLCFTLLSFFSNTSIASDTLTPNQTIIDGQTLVSEGNFFELGFFSPGNSKNRYLGIWYKNIPIPTIVWVANRDNPIANSSGVLKLEEEGKLVLLNEESKIIWSTNGSNAENPIAQLLDSGNLVVTEVNNGLPENNYLWQSFDYPTNTLLPGMKLGWDLNTGFNRFITSWKNADDPSTGDYSFILDPHGFPEIFLSKKLIKEYRSGPWNGVRFSGVPEMKPLEGINFSFINNQDEIYYTFAVNNESIVSRLIVNESGALQRLIWIDTTSVWNVFWYAPKDQCDYYKECGAYGICDTNSSPVCICVEGFEPKYPKDWNLRDGSGGCVRKSNFNCNKDDGFLLLKGMKLPDTSSSVFNMSMSLQECEAECRTNCSCTAYANSNINNGGLGCILWFGDLFDIRDYAAGGQDLYVRVLASELGKGGSIKKNDSHKQKTIIVSVSVISAFLLLGLSFFFIWKEKIIKRIWRCKPDDKVNRVKSQELPLFDVLLLGKRDYSDENNDDLELPLLDLDTIEGTTNNFSDANKLGQGGFGCVYKGTFADGQQIAVKRLSKTSGQGIEEFKNEVKLIARLQHRNLVRLLGCCIEGEEKMLIYEYMQNKSLDFILFDKTKNLLLDWQKRFNIIVGIARGLLYLHQDSRFRIIHRDLKASNVLLDEEMNPKISDFGMARIFGGDQTEANTKKVVGTYGYMSPEYAMDGLFSVKSDVFSYGVLVLEIVSGMKNRGFYHSNSQLNLLGHAWKLWEEGICLDLMDASMGDSCSSFEILRCIQVGLLCVQEQAEDRPTMGSVVLMLSSETATLPQPKQPGFALGRFPSETNSSFNKQESCTVNEVTVTILDPR